MDNVFLIVLSSISISFSIIIFSVLFLRRKSSFIEYRSSFYIIGSFACLCLLVLSTSAPLFFSEPEYQLGLIFIFNSAFMATYISRILYVFDRPGISFFQSNIWNIIFDQFLFILTTLVFSLPLLTIYTNREHSYLTMMMFGVAISAITLILSFSAFCSEKRDIVRTKNESFTVLTISFLNWITIASLNLMPNVATDFGSPVVWINFGSQLCITYFYVILPLVSSFRNKENSIFTRSRIISERLLENDNPFDEDILCSNQCLESVLFFKEVHDFIEFDYKDENESYEKALGIHRQFLDDNSSFDLFVPKSIKCKIKKKLENDLVDRDIFNEAIEHVWANNIQQMPRKVQSDYYHKKALSFLWWK